MRGRLVPAVERLGAFVLISGFLVTSAAWGKSRLEDNITHEVVKTVREIPIPDMFIAAGIFLVFGIFAKYQEARGIYVLGSFLMTMACVGVGVVTFLTSDVMERPKNVGRFGESSAEPPAPPPPPVVAAVAPAEPAKAAGVGADCKKSSDCGDGTVCAHVAGSRHCWAPCGEGGSCAAGFACLAASKDQTVCVR